MRHDNTNDFVLQSNTQRAAILRLLIDARDSWVPLPKIMALAAQYNTRILELRRMGFDIENRTQRVDGVRRSWFRLVSSPASPPNPEAKPESDWQDRPRVTGLPLWDGNP
jgi:hypothetical protein